MIENADWRNCGIMHAVLARLGSRIRHILVDIMAVGIWSWGSIHSCLWLPTHHRLRGHLPKIIRHWPSLVIGARRLVGLRVGRPIVLAIRPHAVQLQADASRARPCVSRGSVALDLPSPATFACSDYVVLVVRNIYLATFKSMVVRTS